MTVTLGKAKDLLGRLDEWLCLPGGHKRCSPKQIEVFLGELLILPPTPMVPDSLPYLADRNLKRRLETGESDLSNPVLRQVVVTEYIVRKINAPQPIAEEIAIAFLLLET